MINGTEPKLGWCGVKLEHNTYNITRAHTSTTAQPESTSQKDRLVCVCVEGRSARQFAGVSTAARWGLSRVGVCGHARGPRERVQNGDCGASPTFRVTVDVRGAFISEGPARLFLLLGWLLFYETLADCYLL